MPHPNHYWKANQCDYHTHKLSATRALPDNIQACRAADVQNATCANTDGRCVRVLRPGLSVCSGSVCARVVPATCSQFSFDQSGAVKRIGRQQMNGATRVGTGPGIGLAGRVRCILDDTSLNGGALHAGPFADLQDDRRPLVRPTVVRRTSRQPYPSSGLGDGWTSELRRGGAFRRSEHWRKSGAAGSGARWPAFVFYGALAAVTAVSAVTPRSWFLP